MHGLTKKKSMLYVGSCTTDEKTRYELWKVKQINDRSCPIDEKVNAKRQPNPLVANVNYV